MTYSSIINNPYCKCGCGKVKTLGFKGYNIACRPDLKEEKLNDHKKKQALIIDATKVRKLAPAAIDNKVEDAQMQLYWMLAKKELALHPYCQECNTFIPEKIKQIGKNFTLNGYRCATAHIFPKALFPSVAAHPLNRLFLGAGCGCHDRTHRLDTFSDMKVFALAVERFQQFRHLIKEKHKYLDQFIKYADGTI